MKVGDITAAAATVRFTLMSDKGLVAHDVSTDGFSSRWRQLSPSKFVCHQCQQNFTVSSSRH